MAKITIVRADMDVAKALAEQLVADARAAGQRLVPPLVHVCARLRTKARRGDVRCHPVLV